MKDHPMKDHPIESKFQAWYANEVTKQLKTTLVESIKVKVNLAVVKSLVPTELLQFGTSWKKPQIAINGFYKAGILDAIDLWLFIGSGLTLLFTCTLWLHEAILLYNITI